MPFRTRPRPDRRGRPGRTAPYSCVRDSITYPIVALVIIIVVVFVQILVPFRIEVTLKEERDGEVEEGHGVQRGGEVSGQERGRFGGSWAGDHRGRGAESLGEGEAEESEPAEGVGREEGATN